MGIPLSPQTQGEIDLVAGAVVAVNGKSAGLIQTPTITAGLYAAGQNVGGLLTFANAALFAAGGGVLKDCTIVDDASQSAELELWLFNQTFTAGADQAAWTPVEAELHNLITILTTADGTYFTAPARWFPPTGQRCRPHRDIHLFSLPLTPVK